MIKGILMKPFLAAQARKGIKTETRRDSGLEYFNKNPDNFYFFTAADGTLCYNSISDFEDCGAVKPLYNRGDVLYIKEPFFAYGYWHTLGNDRTKFRFRDLGKYMFEDSPPTSFMNFKRVMSETYIHGYYKRSPLFMPKTAARAWLKVTNCYLERLNKITNNSCRAEGILKETPCPGTPYRYYNYNLELYNFYSPVKSFETLWEKINGQGSFDNKWVWVIQFELTDKPAGI